MLDIGVTTINKTGQVPVLNVSYSLMGKVSNGTKAGRNLISQNAFANTSILGHLFVRLSTFT